MFGKEAYLNSLKLRKELLIAESEINRIQLLEEWQAITHEVHDFSNRVKSVGSIVSAAAVIVAGASAFCRVKPQSTQPKSSWFQSALKYARIAASIWLP